jgi:hypothetical protein
MVGELGATGPTHHGERALMLVWLAGALLVATAGAALVRLASPVRLGAFALSIVLFGALVIRPRLGELEPFARRQDEESIGRAARALCSDAKLAIDAPDYGYFAVLAAFGDPGRTAVLDDHDPRRRAVPDPFRTKAALGDRLQREGFGCLVTAGDHAALATALGSRVAAAGDFVLVRVPARGRGPGEEVSPEAGRGLP